MGETDIIHEETIAKMDIKESENDNKKNKDIKRITCRQDFTPYFAESDHSINQIHQSEVSLLVN